MYGGFLVPPGEVDRSPCGSGTCARLAILAAGTVLETVDVDGRAAVIPRIPLYRDSS